MALALALGAVACGSDDDGGAGGGGSAAKPASESQARVAAAYDEFIRDLYGGRWKEACAGYSSAYVKAYPEEIGLADSCVGTMKLEFAGVRETDQLPRVTDVEADSPTKALAVVTRADGNDALLDMVLEDGEWKIDGLSDRHRERARTRTSPPDPVPLDSR